MPKILGESRVGKHSYKLKRKRCDEDYAGIKSLYLALKEKKIFRYPVDNFARFDKASKIISIAVSLAFHDAGLNYKKLKNRETGIISTSRSGSLVSQVNYFKDYIECGRVLGRGNFFIYTLPTSPLAEVAIHFGLRGPLFYLGLYKNSSDDNLIEEAKYLISLKQAKMMLAISSTIKETTASLIG